MQVVCRRRSPCPNDAGTVDPSTRCSSVLPLERHATSNMGNLLETQTLYRMVPAPDSIVRNLSTCDPFSMALWEHLWVPGRMYGSCHVLPFHIPRVPDMCAHSPPNGGHMKLAPRAPGLRGGLWRGQIRHKSCVPVALPFLSSGSLSSSVADSSCL